MLCIDQGMKGLGQTKDKEQHSCHDPERNLASGAPGEEAATEGYGEGETTYASNKKEVAEPIEVPDQSLA